MIRCCLILIRRCTVFLLTVNTSAELIKLMENHHPSPQAMHVMVSYAVHRHCSASAIHKDDFLTSAKKGKMDLLNDLKTLNEGSCIFCLFNYRLTAALGNYSFLVFHFNEYGCVYLAEDTIKSMTRGWIISRLYVCFIPHHQHAISQQFDATAPMMSLCEKR
ncbi:stAR-related lipid transfer protein 9 [Trichinella spiralis]|uniref:stAR-related lipid transfer protein 9 n=1 Tax=Trichinella spiralis TaxID=6334 RepID=UPI0001EFC4F2|nr:stAR-related lipid transfer protein 9 [Trichinella spiralis]